MDVDVGLYTSYLTPTFLYQLQVLVNVAAGRASGVWLLVVWFLASSPPPIQPSVIVWAVPLCVKTQHYSVLAMISLHESTGKMQSPEQLCKHGTIYSTDRAQTCKHIRLSKHRTLACKYRIVACKYRTPACKYWTLTSGDGL